MLTLKILIYIINIMLHMSCCYISRNISLFAPYYHVNCCMKLQPKVTSKIVCFLGTKPNVFRIIVFNKCFLVGNLFASVRVSCIHKYHWTRCTCLLEGNEIY